MRRLIIARGLTGSGKSTLVDSLCSDYAFAGNEVEVCSADHFFLCKCCGQYVFDASKLPYAHAWCQDKARNAARRGVSVIIIDNTNVTAAECLPYVLAGRQHRYDIQFIEPNTPWKFNVDELVRRNTHGVPRHAIERMLSRWEPDLTVQKVLNCQPRDEQGSTHDERAARYASRNPFSGGPFSG